MSYNILSGNQMCFNWQDSDLFLQIAFRCIFYLFQDSMTVDTNNPDSLETKTSPQSEEDIFLISCREGQERY